MTDFDDALRDADGAIFAALGGKGVLQDAFGRRYIVQCIVDQDVDVLDDFGKVIARRDYASFMPPPRATPARDWKIESDGITYVLDMPESSDGSVQTWSLRK